MLSMVLTAVLPFVAMHIVCTSRLSTHLPQRHPSGSVSLINSVSEREAYQDTADLQNSTTKDQQMVAKLSKENEELKEQLAHLRRQMNDQRYDWGDSGLPSKSAVSAECGTTLCGASPAIAKCTSFVIMPVSLLGHVLLLTSAERVFSTTRCRVHGIHGSVAGALIVGPVASQDPGR